MEPFSDSDGNAAAIAKSERNAISRAPPEPALSRVEGASRATITAPFRHSFAVPATEVKKTAAICEKRAILLALWLF